MEDKVDRLQQFRELRSTIRGSDTILVVGVDVAKDKHYAFFGTANGRTLWKKLIFDNSIQSFNRLRSMAQDLSTQYSLRTCVFGLEPTASYHKPLAEYLIKNGEQVVYVSNVAAKNNRALLDGRWDKNDTKDAANIADLVGQGRCQFYDLAVDGLRELRSLLAYRAKLKKQEHALRMRIRNTLLAQYFPELDKQMPQGGQDGLILDIIAQDFAPARIASMSPFFLNRKAELEAELQKIRDEKNYTLAALLVTDIVQGTSLLLTAGPKELPFMIGYPAQETNLYLAAGVLSRKKQLVPHLLKIFKD